MCYSTAAGVDYVPQMATFVFDDVTSIRCIVVTVNDDSDPEELSEFFAVAMSTTDPAANIPDLDSNVEIQNDDSTLLSPLLIPIIGNLV